MQPKLFFILKLSLYLLQKENSVAIIPISIMFVNTHNQSFPLTTLNICQNMMGLSSE